MGRCTAPTICCAPFCSSIGAATNRSCHQQELIPPPLQGQDETQTSRWGGDSPGPPARSHLDPLSSLWGSPSPCPPWVALG